MEVLVVLRSWPGAWRSPSPALALFAFEPDARPARASWPTLGAQVAALRGPRRSAGQTASGRPPPADAAPAGDAAARGRPAVPTRRPIRPASAPPAPSAPRSAAASRRRRRRPRPPAAPRAAAWRLRHQPRPEDPRGRRRPRLRRVPRAVREDTPGRTTGSGPTGRVLSGAVIGPRPPGRRRPDDAARVPAAGPGPGRRRPRRALHLGLRRARVLRPDPARGVGHAHGRHHRLRRPAGRASRRPAPGRPGLGRRLHDAAAPLDGRGQGDRAVPVPGRCSTRAR